MATLTTAQKAPLLDENGDQLLAGTVAVSSDDNSIAYVENQGANLLYVVASAVGTCTITATRGSDTATLEVTVTGSSFSIQLGTPEPK